MLVSIITRLSPDYEASERELRYQIAEAGYRPQQRDILYNYIDRDGINDLDEKKSMPFEKLSVAFADYTAVRLNSILDVV